MAAAKDFVQHGRKVLCVGKNYAKHVAEMASGGAQGDRPLWKPFAQPATEMPCLFLKPTTSYVLEGHPITLPREKLSALVHHEVELALVVGTRCKDVPAADWESVIAGYALALDLTARDAQLDAKEKGLPWSISKGFDTFCPVSRFITKAEIPNPADIELWCEVNGTPRQRGSTANMLHKIPTIVEYCSSVMTLEPGDLILTGTPEGVGEIKKGDKISCGISGILDMTFDVTQDSS